MRVNFVSNQVSSNKIDFVKNNNVSRISFGDLEFPLEDDFSPSPTAELKKRSAELQEKLDEVKKVAKAEYQNAAKPLKKYEGEFAKAKRAFKSSFLIIDMIKNKSSVSLGEKGKLQRFEDKHGCRIEQLDSEGRLVKKLYLEKVGSKEIAKYIDEINPETNKKTRYVYTLNTDDKTENVMIASVEIWKDFEEENNGFEVEQKFDVKGVDEKGRLIHSYLSQYSEGVEILRADGGFITRSCKSYGYDERELPIWSAKGFKFEKAPKTGRLKTFAQSVKKGFEYLLACKDLSGAFKYMKDLNKGSMSCDELFFFDKAGTAVRYTKGQQGVSADVVAELDFVINVYSYRTGVTPEGVKEAYCEVKQRKILNLDEDKHGKPKISYNVNYDTFRVQ